MNIYLDMDDVVADWHTRAQEILKLRVVKDSDRIPQAEWDKLKENLRFYRDLPVMAGAHELVDMCKAYIARNPEYNLRFLSALPHDYSMPFAVYDKVHWGDQHFPGIPVTIGPFSYDKWRHCKNAGDILIDDRHSNCEEWEARGGIAHVYTTWEACKPWLTTILSTNDS
jgi:hypothetical protein